MKIGICGKSGSGKSTVSKLLKNRLDDPIKSITYSILDLDIVGKNISNKKAVLNEISNIFGTNYISIDNKTLNRKKLGELVFNSEKELEKLNKIFFKYIKIEIVKEIQKYENIIIEGAILFEIDIVSKLDKTIYVHSGKNNNETLVKRIIEREKNIEIKTAENRIKIQEKYNLNIDLADIVIENSGNIDELKNIINKKFK